MRNCLLCISVPSAYTQDSFIEFMFTEQSDAKSTVLTLPFGSLQPRVGALGK